MIVIVIIRECRRSKRLKKSCKMKFSRFHAGGEKLLFVVAEFEKLTERSAVSCSSIVAFNKQGSLQVIIHLVVVAIVAVVDCCGCRRRRRFC